MTCQNDGLDACLPFNILSSAPGNNWLRAPISWPSAIITTPCCAGTNSNSPYYQVLPTKERQNLAAPTPQTGRREIFMLGMSERVCTCIHMTDPVVRATHLCSGLQ